MTNQQNARPTLPSLRLNYGAGTFTNTLTGETLEEVRGVIIAKRHGRTLWPRGIDPDPRPECVDGSKYGPCDECQFAVWRNRETPPECSEELTLLVWQNDEYQLVEITARKSQVRIIEQWIGMKAVMDGKLHDQRVTIKMKPEDGLHRLILIPGEFLAGDEKTRLEALAERVAGQGSFEAL